MCTTENLLTLSVTQTQTTAEHRSPVNSNVRPHTSVFTGKHTADRVSHSFKSTCRISDNKN